MADETSQGAASPEPAVSLAGKPWYKSRTIWANIIATGAMIAQSSLGFEVTPEEVAGVLVVVNLVMRYVTKEPLA